MIRIALDFDGTLAQSLQRWVQIYNDIYHEKITIADVSSWDFEKKLGLSTVEKKQIFRKVWTDWYHIRPQEQFARKWVNKLNMIGHVDLVTTINPGYTQFAEKWCMLHGINYKKLVHTEAEDKETYDYDYFIDDNPMMAQRIKKYPDKIQLLYNQNWNQYVDATGNVKRIYSINMAYDIIMKDNRLTNIVVPVEEPDEDFEDDEDEDWDDEDDEEFEDDET